MTVRVTIDGKELGTWEPVGHSADRPPHGGFPGAVVERRAHEFADCERELKARDDYSPGRGTPAVFVCSCGRTFDFYDDEAEGAWWAPREVAT